MLSAQNAVWYERQIMLEIIVLHANVKKILLNAVLIY